MKAKKISKKEKNEQIKETVCYMIQGTYDELEPRNKKFIKKLYELDYKVVLCTLEYIKEEYYSWEVPSKDYNPNSNMNRLEYLFNRNYEHYLLTLNQKCDNIDIEDLEIIIKSPEPLTDYKILAEKVGL